MPGEGALGWMKSMANKAKDALSAAGPGSFVGSQIVMGEQTIKVKKELAQGGKIDMRDEAHSSFHNDIDASGRSNTCANINLERLWHHIQLSGCT